MEVLRQIQIGAVRYKKGDRIDPKQFTKEQVIRLVETGHLKEATKPNKGEKS